MDAALTISTTRLELDAAWYDAIAQRRSCRRYSDRTIESAAVGRLAAFCRRFRLAPGVYVALQEGAGDIFTDRLDHFGAAGARIEGAPWAAAFAGPADCETQIGYVGEAFILEATSLALGTCWVTGSYDATRAAHLFGLNPGERVYAVTPLGHALDHSRLTERMMSSAVRAAARRQVEEIAPQLSRGVGPQARPWPRWAITAVEAARLAPSGGNSQPWRFRLEGGGLVLGSVERPSATAPIDFGVAMLHVELGAQAEGVRGAWERLAPPDVARFIPGEL